MILSLLLGQACTTKVAGIPNKIEVQGTPVATVRHEIVISLEFQQLFKDECARIYDTKSPQYEICVQEKKTQFLEQFMNLLKQPIPTQTPIPGV